MRESVRRAVGSTVRLVKTRYISRRDIEAMTGLGRSAVAALTVRPDFPTPVRLNARVLRYPLAEVEAFLAAARNAGPSPRRTYPKLDTPDESIHLVFITDAA